MSVKTAKVGTRVYIKSGGNGAFGADGLCGTIVSAETRSTSGVFSNESAVKVKMDNGTVWALNQHECELIVTNPSKDEILIPMNPQLKHQLIQLLALSDNQSYAEAIEFLISQLASTPEVGISESFTSGVDTPTHEGMVNAVRCALYGNGMRNKIAAIKLHRELTRVGLKESKEWVESTFGV